MIFTRTRSALHFTKLESFGRRVYYLQLLNRKTAAGTAVAMIIAGTLAIHPDANLHFTGLSLWAVGTIFVAAAAVGASASLRHVLISVIFLTFLEPEILVTRTLAFNLVGDGLLIGAFVSWLIDRPRIPNAVLAPAASLGILAAVFVIWPVANGIPGWRGLYEGAIIARYPMLMFLAATAFRNVRETKPLLIAIGVGSFLLAMAGFIESFHIFRVNTWLYNTYLGWQRLDPAIADDLAREYTRIRGLLGDPLDTGILLAVSLSTWFVGLRMAKSPFNRIVILIGISIILLTIFGTSARTAIATAGVGVVLGVAWLFIKKSPRDAGPSVVHLLVVPTVLMIIIMIAPIPSKTVDTAIERIVRVPSAIGDRDDESIEKRLGEYSRTPFTLLGSNSDPKSGRDSEYLSLMLKFGLFGLLPYLLFWALIAWRAGRAMLSGDDFLGFAVISVVVTVPVSALGSNTLLDPGVMILVTVISGAFLGVSAARGKTPVSD